MLKIIEIQSVQFADKAPLGSPAATWQKYQVDVFCYAYVTLPESYHLYEADRFDNARPCWMPQLVFAVLECGRLRGEQ